ncbi:MAG: hypothetical protein KGJ28_06935 [Alphaproteobacteria bacterium]|nr:hypothetical protein [Alphaproteobacteria bacterium]
MVKFGAAMLRSSRQPDKAKGLGMGKKLMAGTCVLALSVVITSGAEARKPLRCAQPAEVTAMQAAAVQQELMDAALTCGEQARVNYNAFQTTFGPELRRSDKTLLLMFHRAMGWSKGDAAYNRFKTDLAAKAELRRVHGSQDFCTAANLVVSAALAPQKPSLDDFVSGVPVTDVGGDANGDLGSPVQSCQLQLAVTMQGAMAGPDIVPKPNPLRVAALVPPPAPPVMPPPAPVAPPTATPAAVVPPSVEPAKEEPKEKKSGWFSGIFN